MKSIYATPKHDQIHRWVFDLKNRYKFLQFLSSKCGFELDRDTYSSSIEIEKPIFSNNGSHRFTVDGIIDLYSVKHCGGMISDDKCKNVNGFFHVKSFSGQDLLITNGSIYKRIIYDGKPLLNSVSGMISQVKIYANFLKYHHCENTVRSNLLSSPKIVILTFDANDEFNEMLLSQRIFTYHISAK